MAETKEKSTGSGNGGANKNAGEKTKLFREKNLERLESPEQLNDYLRVTSPGVWMILSAVILLLIGVFIWAVFGRIEATTQVQDGEDRRRRERAGARCSCAGGDQRKHKCLCDDHRRAQSRGYCVSHRSRGAFGNGRDRGGNAGDRGTVADRTVL